MLTVPDLVTTALAGAAVYRTCKVESWRGGTLLAASVPVQSASEEGDRSNERLPQRVTFTVPRRADGVDWSPGSEVGHPLAANGQQLHVKLGVGTLGGQVEYFQRGVFVINDTSVDGDTVTVEALSLLALVDEARLVSPFQPTGTLGSTLRGLIEPGLTVDLTAAPSDRSVPTGVNYDEDRLGAVRELLDAWAADGVVTEDGYLRVVPAADDLTPVVTLTDGVGGTVVRANGSSSRDGGFNAVVARGTASDGGQVQGVTYDTTSNHAYGTAWSPYPVPYFFASPLLTTIDQCTQAARTVLARLKRTAGATFAVEMRPDPRLQLGDAVQVDFGDFSGVCSIEGQTLPYFGGTGSHLLTVREVIA